MRPLRGGGNRRPRNIIRRRRCSAGMSSARRSSNCRLGLIASEEKTPGISPICPQFFSPFG